MKKYQTLLLKHSTLFQVYTLSNLFTTTKNILNSTFTPVHLLFLTLAIFYQILYFLIVDKSIADYIKETIDENQHISACSCCRILNCISNQVLI